MKKLTKKLVAVLGITAMSIGYVSVYNAKAITTG